MLKNINEHKELWTGLAELYRDETIGNKREHLSYINQRFVPIGTIIITLALAKREDETSKVFPGGKAKTIKYLTELLDQQIVELKQRNTNADKT